MGVLDLRLPKRSHQGRLDCRWVSLGVVQIHRRLEHAAYQLLIVEAFCLDDLTHDK